MTVNPTPLHPAIRIITVASVCAVAFIAAVVSYSHMQQLAWNVGEQWRSWLIPLSIDGLVVASSMTLLTRHRAGMKGGQLPWAALGGGVIASITANMADAEPAVVPVLLAGWAPVAFAIGFELLLMQRRAERLTEGTLDSRKTPQPEATLSRPEPKPIVPLAASTVSTLAPVAAAPAIPSPIPPPPVVAAPVTPDRPTVPTAPKPAVPSQPATNGSQNGNLPRMRPMTAQEVRQEDNMTQGRKLIKERSNHRQQQAWRMFDADHASGVHRNLSEVGMAIGVSERCALQYRYNWKAARGIKERLKVDA